MNDQLGTPRMITNKSGSLAGVKRHDYLPFGEEIGGPQVALLGGRTTSQGYTGDATRQKFTGYEADGETGLNYAQARYQSSVQGRFTSVDPLGASASVGDPQSFNRYSYVNNNPTNLTDPSGMAPYGADHGWADVSGEFWPTGFDLNRSHFGGPAILFAAEYLWNNSVYGGIQERNHAPKNPYKKNWLGIALNNLLDQAAGFNFTGNANEEISATGEITGICTQEFCSSAGDGPYIIKLPIGWGDRLGPIPGKSGDGDCMQLPQKMLEEQGVTLGEAGFGRLKRGLSVMGNLSNIKFGTLIASGWHPDGYYANYYPYGNHAGIFIKPVPGGFRMFEQVHGTLQIVDKTDIRGGYYKNPNAYNIVLSGARIPGVPGKQRYPGVP